MSWLLTVDIKRADRLRSVSLITAHDERPVAMEKPAASSSTLMDLEADVKQDQMILHVRDGERAEPRVLLASRATLTAQSSVLATRLAEAAADEVRLVVTAPPAAFERLYTMMQAEALSAGGGVHQNGTNVRPLALLTGPELTTTLPLAVQFGAAAVVARLVAAVQQAPTMEGVREVDKWVPEAGVFGGFAWGGPVADLLVEMCLSCSWARNDNRTYFKIEDDDGDFQYRQRIKANAALTNPRPHVHSFNWHAWGYWPRRARTLQVLLDHVWLSTDACGLTRA